MKTTTTTLRLIKTTHRPTRRDQRYHDYNESAIHTYFCRLVSCHSIGAIGRPSPHPPQMDVCMLGHHTSSVHTSEPRLLHQLPHETLLFERLQSATQQTFSVPFKHDCTRRSGFHNGSPSGNVFNFNVETDMLPTRVDCYGALESRLPPQRAYEQNQKGDPWLQPVSLSIFMSSLPN